MREDQSDGEAEQEEAEHRRICNEVGAGVLADDAQWAPSGTSKVGFWVGIHDSADVFIEVGERIASRSSEDGQMVFAAAAARYKRICFAAHCWSRVCVRARSNS